MSVLQQNIAILPDCMPNEPSRQHNRGHEERHGFCIPLEAYMVSQPMGVCPEAPGSFNGKKASTPTRLAWNDIAIPKLIVTPPSVIGLKAAPTVKACKSADPTSKMLHEGNWQFAVVSSILASSSSTWESAVQDLTWQQVEDQQGLRRQMQGSNGTQHRIAMEDCAHALMHEGPQALETTGTVSVCCLAHEALSSHGCSQVSFLNDCFMTSIIKA